MNRSAYGLAALLTATGIAHFIAPRILEQIVPPQIGNARFWVFASGIAELAVAAALVHPKSRTWGARACIVLLLAVYPANIYMAIDRGATTVPAWISYARLPLQPLLIWWAWRISKGRR